MEHKVKLYLTDKGYLKIKLSKGGKVKITLEVFANKLHDYLQTIVFPMKPDPLIVSGFCQLYDNNYGKEMKNSIEKFISTVYLHKNVKWVGDSLDDGYTIAIDSIVYHKEDKDPNDVTFFNETTIKGSKGVNSYVEARVKQDLRLIHKEEVYTMHCSVYKNGGQREKFQIDPKLKGNT